MLDKLGKKKYVSIILLLVCLFACVYIYYSYKDYSTLSSLKNSIGSGNLISFNYGSAMYDQSILIRLDKKTDVPTEAKIYYTLDGNDPTIETGIEYRDQIQLELQESLTIYPIKAVLYYKEEYSDIYEKTYVLTHNATNGYDTKLVSITTDNANLYDYEKGIFVPGKAYDDYVEEYGEENAMLQGNYFERGDEWIRDAHIAMFEDDGDLLLEQNIGMSVAGNTSSSNAVKSLKLYAGNEYDPEKKHFNIVLENEEYPFMALSYVDEYNSLKLRTGSQDSFFEIGGTGNVRFPAISRLVQESGFGGISSSNYAVVFINGEFYGLFDLEQTTSKSFLSNRYSLKDKDKIEKYDGTEVRCLQKAKLTELFQLDFTQLENREKLEEVIDMDNFLEYYSIQIVLNNTDWSFNNFKMWRYTGEYDQNNQYTDHRYRFWIYDTDLTFNTDARYEFFEGSNGDLFENLMENQSRGSDSVFPHIMESPYYRDKFIVIIQDLLNTTFTADHIEEVIQEEYSKIHELQYGLLGDVVSSGIDENIRQMLTAVHARKREIETDIDKYFGFSKKVSVSIETSEGIQVSTPVKNLYASSSYEGEYYQNVLPVLRAEAYPGYQFESWNINGKIYHEKDMALSENMVENDILEVKAVAKPAEGQFPIISSFYAKGSTDWLEIYNSGMEPVELSDYFVTDNVKKIDKFRLPRKVLYPGEIVRIYGKKNFQNIGDFTCNFSLRDGETLQLTNGEEVLDAVEIPMMSAVDVYQRYDMSNDWVFALTEKPFYMSFQQLKYLEK